MNIIIGNQKGGVGKTTHAILLSNYLALQKQKDLIILDLDFQGSIKTRWDQDLELFDNEPLYEVMQLDLQEINPIFDNLNNADCYVIFDLPGKIDDNNLVAVYQNADIVICPFSYDKLTFESTLVFTQVIRHINIDVPIVFLPNRLKMSVNYTIRQKVDNILLKYGVIAPAISDRVALQRLDCLTFSEEAKSVLTKAYDFIYEKYLVNHVEMTKSEDHG
jgi:chromosome partitioning protein